MRHVIDNLQNFVLTLTSGRFDPRSIEVIAIEAPTPPAVLGSKPKAATLEQNSRHAEITHLYCPLPPTRR